MHTSLMQTMLKKELNDKWSHKLFAFTRRLHLAKASVSLNVINTKHVNLLRPHIFVSNITIIGLENGLSPGRRQAIIWTNAGTLLIGPLGTKFGEILIEIYTLSFKKMHLKMSSGKCRPFCFGLNVLRLQVSVTVLLSMGWLIRSLNIRLYKHILHFAKILVSLAPPYQIRTASF